MDGVISNFNKAAKEEAEKAGVDKITRPDLIVNYRNLDLIPGARDALIRLNDDFDIFIATTPPWTRPEVWMHKREWIEEHFHWLAKKLIYTHR